MNRKSQPNVWLCFDNILIVWLTQCFTGSHFLNDELLLMCEMAVLCSFITAPIADSHMEFTISVWIISCQLLKTKCSTGLWTHKWLVKVLFSWGLPAGENSHCEFPSNRNFILNHKTEWHPQHRLKSPNDASYSGECCSQPTVISTEAESSKIISEIDDCP